MTYCFTRIFFLAGFRRKDNLSFIVDGNLRFCGVSGSSRFFLGVWITCVSIPYSAILFLELPVRCMYWWTHPVGLAQVAFDVSAFSLLLLNALTKPRVESIRLLNILYEDGIVFFLVRSCLWYLTCCTLALTECVCRLFLVRTRVAFDKVWTVEVDSRLYNFSGEVDESDYCCSRTSELSN